MSDKSQSKLLELLKAIRSLPVNKTDEKRAYSQVLHALSKSPHESSGLQERLNEKPREAKTKAKFESLLVDLAKDKQCSLSELLDRFPVVNFIAIFLTELFKHIRNLSHIPAPLTNLIDKLEFPLIQLAMQQPRMILEPQHIGFQLINKLADYAPFWRDEKQLGYPIYSKLSQLLIFNQLNKQKITERLSQALLGVTQVRDNQQKRALIFEKRLKETFRGKAKIITAKKITDQIIEGVMRIGNLSEVLVNLFDKPWRKLLYLECLRGDDKALQKAIKLMHTLIISLHPIESQQSLDQLFDDLPNINEQLKNGLLRVSFEDTESDGVIAKIEALHIALINDSERSIAESIENKKDQNTPSGSNEEILRLKPTGGFAREVNQSKTNNKSNNKSDKLPSDIAKNVTENSSLTAFFEEFDRSIVELEQRFASDFSGSQKCRETLKKEFDIEPEQWFWIECENSRKLNKLAIIIEEVDQYVFVAQGGNQSHCLDSDDFLKRLKLGKIKRLKANNLYQSGLKECILSLTTFVQKETKKHQVAESKLTQIDYDKLISESQIRKTRLTGPSEDPVQPSNKIEEDIIRENTQPLDINKTFEQPEPISTNLAPRYTPIDISNFSVGEWTNMKIDQDFRRCKLAAKIASKGLYIFVDRRGKKICQLTVESFKEKILLGDIEIIDDELYNDKSLESIISTTRNMKTEH